MAIYSRLISKCDLFSRTGIDRNFYYSDKLYVFNWYKDRRFVSKIVTGGQYFHQEIYSKYYYDKSEMCFLPNITAKLGGKI